MNKILLPEPPSVQFVDTIDCKVVPLYAGPDKRQSNLWQGLDTHDSGASQGDSEIPARSQILQENSMIHNTVLNSEGHAAI